MKKSLTWEQKHVVSHDNGHALVKAVPGSGKTVTLIKRVERLVKSGIDHRSILIVMYNKSASQTFKAKLSQVLDARMLPEVRTLHSLALKIIHHAENQRILKKKELISPDDHRYSRIVRQSYREGFECEEDYIPAEDIEELELFITRWRAEGVTPDEASSDPSINTSGPGYVRAYRRYCELLEESNLRTFDDCLSEANYLLNTNSYQGPRYKHIIIDEYQDVNLAQHTLICSLTKSDTSVMAVGDINQCIYEWRGARPDFIGGLFEKSFKGTMVYNLSCTFRFGHTLSLMANSVIRRNSAKLSSLCVSHPSTPRTHAIILHEDNLVEVLQEVSKGSGTRAILARSNASLAEAEIVLRTLGLPFKYLDKGASPLFKRHEIGLLVVGILLCVYGDIDLLNNHPKKKTLLYGFFREAGFGWKRGQLAEALNGVMAPGADLWDFLAKLFRGSHRQENRLKVFERVRQQEHKGASAAAVFGRLDTMGCFHGVGAGGVNRGRSNDKQRGIDKVGRLLQSSQITAQQFLDLTLSDDPEVASSEPFSLSTFHGSKGLEWDSVVMLGLHDSEFPGGSSASRHNAQAPKEARIADEESDEERRLFYVGMTRAKRQLSLLAPGDAGLSKWLQNAWDATPKRKATATRFVYETGFTAAALTSEAIYSRTADKQKASFSKFHQWYLRSLERLRV